MATWKHVLQALIVRISALLAVGLRGVGQLMWRAIGHCETVLRALLHATAVFVGAALGFLLRSVAQVVYWLGTRLAARLAYVAWLPAALRASLDRLAARRFDRDRQRLALWWQDWRHEAQRAIATPFRRAGIALTGRASKRQLQRIALVGILILTVVCGPLSLLGALGVLPIFGQSGPGQPHHVDPSTGTHSIIHLPPAPKAPQSKPLAARPPMAHGFPPHMQPGLLPLDPAKDAQFNGSDGRLEVDVPAGAVSADDVKAAPGNQIALRLTEIAPPSGSNAGGSGIVSFGTYLAELVDGKGRLLSHGLRKNATIKLHYGPDEQAFNLDRAFIVFNGAHPKSVTGLGPSATQGVTHDRTNHLLLAHLPADPALAGNASTDASASVKTGGAALTLPGGFAKAQSSQKAAQTNANKWGFSFNTDAPVAKYGGPDPLNVDLTSGSLTDGIQLDVPPGPAQAMPNITLSYNSGTASEQHSPQAAAGWMGEGWNATLGQISWAERDLSVDCKTCGSTWRNVWYLNDPFGTSTELIPPVTNVSTNYDDTPYYYCATGNASAVACPIQFQTARESYARVYAYRGPINTIGGSGQYRACWRVYLPNGVMEEFGCTPDSVQYYPIFKNGIPGGTNNADFLYITNLYLDLITNPQGDQVHITYQSDTETVTDPATGAQKTYPRDTVLSTIEWDSPTCVNRSQACTGASWAPHYRVQFNASHTPSRLTNSPSFCNTASNVRCDDPVNLTGSGQLGAPLVESTFVLNDVAVQTNLAGTWNTVRDYQLSYAQNGPATITDPVTGLQESAAGYLNLTQLQEVGDDGTSAYPAQTFSYTYVTQYYEDGTLTPYSTTFCGPSWNTGGNGGTCDLWSQSYAGNSWYLTSISNGQGLQETISWQNARNNTHGANAGLASPASPLACNGHEGMGYPCNEADDQQWSRATVGERDDAVVQVTQNGQGGQPTSTTVTSRYVYTYTLATLTANECTDCLYGMYWGSQNDGDYLDYYNPRFMGFAQTSVSKPDGSLETHTFYSTEGWGVWNTNNVNCTSNLPPKTSCHNSPWWDLGNAGHGLETSASYYDTNGTTLLKQTSNTYTAVCPPGGVGASQSGNWNNESVDELGVSNPMAVCDVQRTQSVTKTFDGSGSYTSDTEAYTYDNSSTGYGRPTQTTSTVNGGGSSPTTVVDKTTYTAITSLVVPTANKSNTSQEASWSGGLYIIDLPTTTNTQDSQQVQSACTQTTYDGSGNPIEADQFTGCGSQNPVALKTTITYDNAGNPVATTDSDANGGVSGHTGCNDGVSGDNNTYTSCSRFNDNLTQARIVSTGNASNQSSSTTYTNTAAGGYGLWPTQITDPNNQQTAIAYDALGRVTSTTLPGETAGLSTTSKVYANWCSGTSAQSPCVEEDTTQRLNSTTTVTARDFYDGQGRLVETRTPAPSGQDVVQYTLYNADGEVSASSVAYFVAAYTGAAGSAAYSIPDSTQAVISATYDGVGRTLQVTDALSNVTTAAYSVVCNAPGTGDAGCYEQTLMTNADTHRHGTLTDGFGRATYDQSYSGNSGSTYVLYATTTTTYDTSGRMMNVLHPDGVTQTAFTYDTAGRMTSMSDPDRGSESYTYDPNSNLIQATDARGASGTTYLGYDGQNRTTWRNTTNSSSGAYVTYSYDSTANGNDGVGRLTGETFSGGPNRSLSGSDSYVYDG